MLLNPDGLGEVADLGVGGGERAKAEAPTEVTDVEQLTVWLGENGWFEDAFVPAHQLRFAHGEWSAL